MQSLGTDLTLTSGGMRVENLIQATISQVGYQQRN